MAIQQSITSPLAGAITKLFTASAHGNVFTSPGLSAYSNTVVSTPTLFPFAKGVGLMGEAGPEAIMPLKRLSGGDLGVKAQTTAPNINVTVNEAPAGTTARVQQSQDGSNIDIIIEMIESRQRNRVNRGYVGANAGRQLI